MIARRRVGLVWVEGTIDSEVSMEPDQDGEWVKWTDYQRIASDLAAAEAEVQRLRTLADDDAAVDRAAVAIYNASDSTVRITRDALRAALRAAVTP